MVLVGRFRKRGLMKIGEFAGKFNISVSTVRHYINLGLLVPEKDGFQYRFTEADCEEMSIIASMKEAGLKLSELHQYLALFRFYNKEDYLLYEKLQEYLDQKKEALHAQRRQIDTHIRSLDGKIREIEEKRISMMGKTADSDGGENKSLPGFPLNAVNLLRCPHCESRLRLHHVEIAGTFITTGTLTCKCGYHAEIRDGVVFTENLRELEKDSKFLDCYFGEENLITNEDGMFLMARNMLTGEYLANLHRSSLWIHKKLEHIDLHAKTILFPDTACQYLYSSYDCSNTADSLFLVTALTERTIHAMRQHIANANPELKVAYVINQDGNLPLEKNCIDVIVDYMGTTNLSFFEKMPYYDLISPYLAEDAVVAGTMEYYRRNSDSLKKIRQRYPDCAPGVFTLDFMDETLRRNGFQIKQTEIIGEKYDPGQFFEYHVPGDIRTNMVYFARRNRRERAE